MDAVMLSRIQFGLAAGFHFIFPAITLGLSLIILLVEYLHVRRDDENFRSLSSFLVKILGLVFTMGVATGIVLEFSFGTNWSEYSRAVGDIFGSPLAAEGVFAFFLESVFLGVLLFGRKRVSKRVYLLSAFLVFFASHLSGVWIIIANSWMQTPAGFEWVEGRAVLTDFFAAALNPSFLPRYVHVVLSSWIAASLFTAGISAWYLLKGRSEALFRPLLKMSMVIFILTGTVMFLSGHWHAVQVANTQPVKMAAFEALWKTQRGAPMSLIGIPDEGKETTHLEIAVPRLLSLLIHFDPDAEVTGLGAFPKEDRPPVALTYFSYHVMIALGTLFLGIAALGALFLVKDTIHEKKWFLRALIIAIPLPHVAIQFGWIAAEVGRQPWVVYNYLRTADAVSVVVPPWQVAVTLVLFSALYTLLFLVFLLVLRSFIRKGPQAAGGEAY